MGRQITYSQTVIDTHSETLHRLTKLKQKLHEPAQSVGNIRSPRSQMHTSGMI